MADLALLNTTVVDPQSSHHLRQVDIEIKQGYVSRISPSGTLKSDSETHIIDGSDLYLSPGWVDTCVHLCDPGFEWKENLAQLAAAALSGGFTHILCYPNTEPVIDNSQMVYSLRSRAQALPIHVHVAGALTHHIQGKELAELYDMHEAGALAFTDGIHPLQHAGLLLRALQYLLAFDGLLIRYPVDLSLTGEGHVNEGEVATSLGMKGIPELSESATVARELDIVDYAAGKIHFQPLTSPRALAKIQEARSGNGQVSVGTTAFHLAYDDTQIRDFDVMYKVFPPLRNTEQVQLLREAVRRGEIDVLCSAHQAQSVEEKHLDFAMAEFGVLGLQTTFSLANEHLVMEGYISLTRLIEMLSINPRHILQLPAVIIEEGHLADFTLFHPTQEWTYTSAHIPSRSKNTPLIGKALKGLPKGVISKGQYYPSGI